MRLVVDATPEEFREKRGTFLNELAKALAPVDPGLADVLAKAMLPHPEPELKFPVLREIAKRTQESYQEHLQAMLDEIGEVLDQSKDQVSGVLGKSETDALDAMQKAEGWVPLVEELGDILWKADVRPHKYIRRVPYTDSMGHQRYRYYYSESAMGRSAQVGEEVSLGEHRAKVTNIGADGSVTMHVDGEERTVQHHEWHDLLAHHYGQGYYEHAEKRARQAINAVLKHVSGEVLEDLKGTTDEERVAELKTRVPAAYAKLEQSFRRAGVDIFQAKQIIGHTMERRGWSPEARATIIGAVFTQEGATVAKNHRQIIAGAENLAGGAMVEPKHVATAIELRRPRFQGDTFAVKVGDIAKAAETELTKLQHLLHVAQNTGDVQAALGAQALAFTSTVLTQLNMLATAYPGMRDKLLDPLRRTMLEVPSVAPRTAPTRNGATGTLYVAGEGGQPKALKIRYRLVEAKDLVPSHDPESFQPHPDYPADVQERAYHRDKAEQQKVIRNATRMNVAFLINTNPDAVNGPPIVTTEGHVLGGNSRTMSMQRAYSNHPEQAKRLKDYLREHATEVGLTEHDVDAMEAPILVRELDPEDKSPKALRTLVRQMNESFTQAMDPRTYQVALGRRLDSRALDSLINNMEEDETLNDFLGTARSRLFVDHLSRLGVIDERNSNQYIQKGTRRLNEDGKTLVARILVGNMVDDADTLSDTLPSLLKSIAGVVPYMMQAKSAGAEFDLSEDLRTALHAYNYLHGLAEEGKSVTLSPEMSDFDFQHLFSQMNVFGEVHPVTKSSRAMTLLETLIRKPGPRQMAWIFREYTKAAAANRTDQMSLAGPTLTPHQVLTFAIEAGGKREKAEAEAKAKKKKKAVEDEEPGLFKAEAVGGPYMGPRGGKYADPELTIPWREGMGQGKPAAQPVEPAGKKEKPEPLEPAGWIPKKPAPTPQKFPKRTPVPMPVAGDLAPQTPQEQAKVQGTGDLAPKPVAAPRPTRKPVPKPLDPVELAHAPPKGEADIIPELADKLPKGKTPEEHVQIAKQELAKHQAAFAGMKASVDQIAQGGLVQGRVKKLYSMAEKLARKSDEYPDATKLLDTSGLRIQYNSIAEVKAAVDRAKGSFEILFEENYIDKPKGDYRSHHLIIRDKQSGLAYELQIRTKNQNSYADWAHNAYKPMTPDQEAHKNDPEIKAYSALMSEYIWQLDNQVAQPIPPPECPPVVKYVFGCVLQEA